MTASIVDIGYPSLSAADNLGSKLDSKLISFYE